MLDAGYSERGKLLIILLPLELCFSGGEDSQYTGKQGTEKHTLANGDYLGQRIMGNFTPSKSHTSAVLEILHF